MYKETIRTLRKDEISVLKKRDMSAQKRELVKSFIAWSGVWFSLILLLVLVHWFVWPSRLLFIPIFIFGLFELINLGTLFDWSRYAREMEEYRHENYPKVLEENAAKVTTITAERVAVLPEREDEGDLLIFDVGSNQLYWLHGQDIFPTLGNRHWPNSHFEISFSKSYPVRIGIRGIGTRIKQVVQLRQADFPDLCLPNDSLLDGTFDDIPTLFSRPTASID